MPELTITCPRCGDAIALTEALAAPLLAEERKKVEAQATRIAERRLADVAAQARAEAAKDAAANLQALQAVVAERDATIEAAQKNELALRLERERLSKERDALELTVQRRVDDATAKAVGDARAQVDGEWAVKFKASQDALKKKDAKLRAAEDAELKAREMREQAEETLRQADLTLKRRLDEERAKVRETAVRERDQEFRLKLGEKDKQLSDLKEQIDELRHRGDRTAQQLVGDVLEQDLESVLRAAFPTDTFERVKKGRSGADLVQVVSTSRGLQCGRILWECKRTKAWSDAWLAKLRDDLRSVKADVAALVSVTMPGGVAHFDLVDGVWVSSVSLVVAMATALRHGLAEAASARAASAGALTKKGEVYQYVTSAGFRQRVHGLAEPILQLREGLDQEKRSLTRLWSVREQQLERAMRSLASMYGDLQSIVGTSLPGVAELELPEPDQRALPGRTFDVA